MGAGIPYKHILVDPQNKPEDFKQLYASIVGNDYDSAKVPTIIGNWLGLCSALCMHVSAHCTACGCGCSLYCLRVWVLIVLLAGVSAHCTAWGCGCSLYCLWV
jgi:hypothetical protein